MNPERVLSARLLSKRWSGSLPDSQTAIRNRASSMTSFITANFSSLFDLPISGACESDELRIPCGSRYPDALPCFGTAYVSGQLFSWSWTAY